MKKVQSTKEDQIKLNNLNSERFKKLDKKDRDKIKAIEKATEILIDAKVPAYIFGLIKFPDSQNNLINQVIQYNTLQKVCKTDKYGVFDLKGRITAYEMLRGMCYHIFNYLINGTKFGKDKVKNANTINSALSGIYQFWRKITTGEKDENIELLKNFKLNNKNSSSVNKEPTMDDIINKAKQNVQSSEQV